MCTSLLINTDHTRKSFTILADDDDSMNDRFDLKVTSNNLPSISNKIKSIYHQNCIIPNEDFSILYNSITSKLQPPSQQITLLNANKNLYSPSKEFFNKVSSKLRDLRPKVIPREEEAPKDTSKMERPMFITTVRSGTFLEPPPEVAALLGLRKNSFNSNNTNSSNSSTGKTQNNDGMYSFASKPRILKSNLHTNFASRSLFRVENRREKREILNEPLPKITNDTSEGGPSYGNTMFDRRVARGSNFAAQRPNVISTEHVLSRQAEARRRAAVRQRAQIRARKLRLGTPPPIDGRRHGQIQTDKYLEELTERPPDKSIACQADLPVEHHSPVYSLDSNSNTTTGVEAETQIYPGDLPDIDDELPSVVSSIVNKILQEAILEINDEIEVIRLRTLASEQKRALANSSGNDENGVITKAQLNMLIQQAINELKNSEQSESNDKNYDDIDSNHLFEKIFHEIKNMVTDVKFLTGIIKTQLENWPEESDQNTAGESEPAENEQPDDKNDNVSEAGTTDLRRETLSVTNDLENQTADEVLQQMDAEIDAYKTDDFEEESKDLNETNNDENEASDRRNDEDTDSIRDNEDVNLDATKANEGSDDRPSSANEQGNSSTQPTNDADEPTVTATEVSMEQGDTSNPDNESNEQNESTRVKRSIEENTTTDSETTQVDQEVPNNSQSADTNDEQVDTKQDQPSVIISEHNDEDSNVTNDESTEPPKSTTEETAESTNRDSAESTNINDTPSDNSAADSNQDNDNQPPETNNETSQASENTPRTSTIPTLNASVLDAPINDSNPEHDIVITELDNDANQSSTTSATNQPTVTIPTLNNSVLDPPVNDSNAADNTFTSDTNADADESSEDIPPTTSATNPETMVIPTMNTSLLDPPVNDSGDQASEQETSANSTNDEKKDENQDENNDSVENSSSANPPDDNQNEASNPNDGANKNNQLSGSKEEQTNQNDQASAQPSSDPDTTNNQSSETTIEKEPASTNEDDNDVVAVQPSSVESPREDQGNESRNLETDPADQTSESSIPATTQPETTSDNTQEDPKDDSNQNSTDNISETSSSATAKAESAQEKPSDTESVENNELQSNTAATSAGSINSTELQSPINDNGSSKQSEKPLNTDNNTSDIQSNNIDQSNHGAPADEPDQSKQDPENASLNSAADSLDTSERPSENDPTADATSLDRESSKSPVTENNDSANPMDNDLRNNNQPKSHENDKLIEANNNDSTIQSKNPTTIVQNGNIITNR